MMKVKPPWRDNLMDFAMFMEKYGYKALWYAVLLFAVVGIPALIVRFLSMNGLFTTTEATLAVVLIGLFSITVALVERLTRRLS